MSQSATLAASARVVSAAGSCGAAAAAAAGRRCRTASSGRRTTGLLEQTEEVRFPSFYSVSSVNFVHFLIVMTKSHSSGDRPEATTTEAAPASAEQEDAVSYRIPNSNFAPLNLSKLFPCRKSDRSTADWIWHGSLQKCSSYDEVLNGMGVVHERVRDERVRELKRRYFQWFLIGSQECENGIGFACLRPSSNLNL